MKQVFRFISGLSPSARKATLTLSLSNFLYYFNFFWLIQNVYMLGKGINYTQLSLVLSIWSFSIILFEIPSGIVADKFGRKPVIIFGKLAFLVGILIFALFPSFFGFTLGVIMFGIHESFISGAQEALLYDSLEDCHQKKLFRKALAFVTASREIGLGTGALLAGFITQISIRYNLIGSTLIAVLGFLASFLLIESKIRSKPEEIFYLAHFKSAVDKIRKNYYLSRIVIFSLTVIVSYVVISEYFVVSLKNLKLSFTGVGIIAAIEAVCFSFGSYISQKFVMKDKKTIYFLLSALMAIFMFLISLGTIPLVVGGFLILRIIKAISEIVSLDDWQSYVESNQRATTISINSFVKNIFYIFFAIIFGKIADGFGLFKAFYLTAFISLSYIFFIKLIQKAKKSV